MNIVNFGQSSLENAQPSIGGWKKRGGGGTSKLEFTNIDWLVIQGNFILGYSENFTFENAKLYSITT